MIEVNQGIFYLPACDVELYECLKANADKFEDAKERLKDAISFVPEKVKSIFEADRILLYQQGYFEALSANPYFANLADEWQKKTNTKTFCNE